VLAAAFERVSLTITAAAQMSQGKSCCYPPKAHIELDQDEIANGARVGRAGSRLEHVPAILRVEHRRNDAEGAKLEKGEIKPRDTPGTRGSGNEKIE
jgi:hypothetical protein